MKTRFIATLLLSVVLLSGCAAQINVFSSSNKSIHEKNIVKMLGQPWETALKTLGLSEADLKDPTMADGLSFLKGNYAAFDSECELQILTYDDLFGEAKFILRYDNMQEAIEMTERIVDAFTINYKEPTTYPENSNRIIGKIQDVDMSEMDPGYQLWEYWVIEQDKDNVQKTVELRYIKHVENSYAVVVHFRRQIDRNARR